MRNPHKKNFILFSGMGAAGTIAALGLITISSTACTFTDKGMTRMLDDNCTTDVTIFIPDGMTLDGRNHTINAVDPASGHFVGSVVQNAGTSAHVKNLRITASNLSNACDAGGDRLRGIMFQGASGSIAHNTVHNINQGASGCQEGNAIEVRNEPFDGTHPNTQTVEVAHNTLTAWQKTGIVANGDVDVNIHHNAVSSSATQPNLAANSIQLGFGAAGTVEQNIVSGNQWCGPSEFVATALLLFQPSDGVTIKQNNIGGNSDVGIYGLGNALTVDNNKVFDDDKIADCNQFDYDIGIGNYGDPSITSYFTNNKVEGFDPLYDGVVGGGNKGIPGKQPGQEFF